MEICCSSNLFPIPYDIFPLICLLQSSDHPFYTVMFSKKMWDPHQRANYTIHIITVPQRSHRSAQDRAASGCQSSPSCWGLLWGQSQDWVSRWAWLKKSLNQALWGAGSGRPALLRDHWAPRAAVGPGAWRGVLGCRQSEKVLGKARKGQSGL